MTNGIDVHGLADLLHLTVEQLLILMDQGAFPTPFVSPRGRFYWPEGSIPEWLVLAKQFKAEKRKPNKQNPGWRPGQYEEP